MSAFQVSQKHISAIVQGVHGTNFSGQNIWQDQKDPTSYFFKLGLLEQCQTEANVLMAENIRSVNHRYNEKDNTESKVKLDLNAKPLSALAVLKLIDCLEYQSCECDDYHNTEAYKLLSVYRSRMACKLPGYDAEEWCI